jgi:ribonuclease T2
MIAVACGGAGNRLKEIRFCFSKDGKPRRCGGNEDQRRMCSSNSMFVPPVRSTAHVDENGVRTQPAPNNAGQYQKTFPRPRLIEGPNGN